MISSIVFAGAERAPERLAIVANDSRLSYGEFARAIEAMIQRFEGAGLRGPGFAVMAVRYALDYWIFALAMRELGLTTVPVFSADNAAALTLDDIRVVVNRPEEPWPGLEELCAKRGWPLARASWDGAMARPVEVGRRRVAELGQHVMQTSATTGDYKMVLMEHRFEAAFMDARRRVDDLHDDTRMAMFDLGTWTGGGYKSAAATWLAGGTAFFWQGDEPWRCLLEPGLTHATTLPMQLPRLLSAPAEANIYQPGMRLHFTGGTPLQPVIDRIRERIAPRLWNSIGTTEAQVYARTPLEAPEDRRWHQLLAERTPQVVDDDDRPVPTGEIGRVRISAADGPDRYLNNPEATAAFFKDGFFYPGDLGQIRADGRMALMGRTTDVINIDGRKVSAAPVEEWLCEHLGAAAACVFSRQDETGDEELHVVLEVPAPLDTAEVARVLRHPDFGGLPRARVSYVRQLPRNANGKVLRAEVRRRLETPSS